MTPSRGADHGLSARDKKNLRYEAEVPGFLQQLHSHVHATKQSNSSKRFHKDDSQDPVLAFLGEHDRETNTQARPESSSRGDGYRSDDDLADAQIVVMKEGKHLSREEYRDATNSQRKEVYPKETVAEPISTIAARHKSARKPTSKTLAQAKNLIDVHRDSRISQAGDKSSAQRPPRKPKKSGGLSFDIDQD
ncbi:hypothetical protein MPSI1_000297 [Malassezia psittaci]|uniref:DUF4604 domain-containing protein n=1 Tax=Malassezia psittaci TaxID=1821823 RepID=A0AAF0F2J8_9BASI|nr:hypothetical protein MPSI1_000297 [Malassezia psittaci]